MQVETDVLPPRYHQPVRIGHGAMGDVLRTRDTVLDRDVAVKLLATRFAQDADVRARFTREGLAAARLSGEPGIVTVYDVGEWRGRPFIVMEYLAGGSLADQLARGVPPVAQALAWLEDAAIALDAGHRHGVVHRDVKPANLLLDGHGRVHVADFGVASAGGLDSLTMTGTILGTAGYLSPEQARGERATPASDVYALAVVAWELLAGRRPFERDSPTAEATAHVQSPPPSLCERRSDLPCPELDAVFSRALAKRADERPGSARELVAELRHALAAGAQTTRIIPRAAPPVPAPVVRRRRSRWPLFAGLLAAALLAGAALATTLGGGGESTAQTTVRTLRITQRGTTVTTSVTVTTSAPPVTTTAAAPPTTTAPAPPRTATSTPPPAGASATALVDRATAYLNAGNYEQAAANAQAALEQLGGTGQTYEAYALYDLGAALANMGDCKDATKALKDSERIQGHRSEIDAAKQLCHGHK